MQNRPERRSVWQQESTDKHPEPLFCLRGCECSPASRPRLRDGPGPAKPWVPLDVSPTDLPIAFGIKGIRDASRNAADPPPRFAEERPSQRVARQPPDAPSATRAVSVSDPGALAYPAEMRPEAYLWEDGSVRGVMRGVSSSAVARS